MQDNYWTRYDRRRVNRRRFLGGSGMALVGGAAILAGCGGDDDDDDTTSTPGGTGSTATQAAPTSEAGRRGGTLRISGPALVVSMDPHDRVTFIGNTTKVYSNLLMTRFSDKTQLFDAAVAVEQPDPMTIRFTMRDGMTFHDAAGNRAVTAQDAAYSINRIATQAQRPGPLAASNLNQFYWGWVDSAEATDDKTLVVHHSKPYASALEILGTPWYAIVAQEVIEANGGFLKADVTADAGSGPYTLTRVTDTGYTWERWAGYWKHTSPSPTFVEDGPYIDKVEWRQIADATALEAAFRAGDIDLMGNSSGNNFLWDKAKADDLKRVSGIEVAESPNPQPLAGNFDMSRWGDDPRFREAASLAFDRDSFIQQVYLGNGRIVGPLGPTIDASFSEDELKEFQKYDPKEARAMWEAAGGNEKFPEIVMLTNPNSVNMMNFVAEDWRQNLGATVRVDNVDPTTSNKRANDFSQPTKDWDFLITTDPGLLTIPEGNLLSNYVPTGYAGRNCLFLPDSPNPKTAELAKKAQELFDAQYGETDPEARKEKLRELQRQLLTTFAPTIPVPILATSYSGYRSTVKNFPTADFAYLQASTGPMRVHDLWLDQG